MNLVDHQRQIKRKLRILKCERFGNNISKKCRHYGISRETFYKWKRSLEAHGEQALKNSKPCPENHKLRTPKETEEKILHIRRTYHLGAQRISWYMQRYHGIKISVNGVQCVLKRHKLNRLPNMKKNSPGPHYKLYNKQVPGHHIQMDVKFLIFTKNGLKIKRYQYTAIDDATRIRVLKIYSKHTQKSSIDFAKHIQKEFPFRINMIRTDNGHEFQSQFHWYLMDEGIEHAYIKKGTPRLNGKVERSHRTDKAEFYQAIHYTGDQDLEQKLKEWQNFYNFMRPHGAHSGKTPYESLHEKLKMS
jgi:transposase InsO family protein